MDEEEFVEKFLGCDDLVVIGLKNDRLLLWHHPDTPATLVLDMLLNSYSRMYEIADDSTLH